MTAGKMAMTYGVMLVAFLAVDLLWLGVFARRYYLKHLGRFFAEKVKWPAAILFYLFFLAGIMIFAVRPSVERNSVSAALEWGLLYGLFTYATYELTNLATLKDWPTPIVVVDILWGMALSAAISVLGFWAATQMG